MYKMVAVPIFTIFICVGFKLKCFGLFTNTANDGNRIVRNYPIKPIGRRE